MAEKFYYGGQAVIEGVMMRGRGAVATAVRRPNGSINVQLELLKNGIYAQNLRRIPLLRGVLALLEAMVLGIKTLLFSANVSLEEEDEQISGWTVWLMLTISLSLSVGLFFLLPLLITRLLENFFTFSTIVFHLIEGIVRLSLFVGYLKLMTLLKDINRLFSYHGAEHKTINAYEAGVPLEPEAIQHYSKAHLRCGTSFLFTVMLIAIIVFSLLGRPSLWLMILSRILLVPVIAALSYEVTHFAGRHTQNKLVRAILYPGLLLQKMTTREPDESQLEVAIAALKRVIAVDQGISIVEPLPDSTDAALNSEG